MRPWRGEYWEGPMARRDRLNLAKEAESVLVRGKSVGRLEMLVGRGDASPGGQGLAMDFASSRTESIKISDIEVAQQVRREFDDESIDSLARSLKEHGLLQPIVVAEKPDGGYLLVAGERRLRAAKRLGWFSIPAVVVKFDPERLKLCQLVENIQRKDLNLVEKAEGVWEYFNYLWKRLGGTGSPDVERLWLAFYYIHGGKWDKVKGELEGYAEVAKECGRLINMPPASVLLFCLIASLEEDVREFLRGASGVSATHVRVMLLNRGVWEADAEKKLELLRKAQEGGLSRKAFEKLVRGGDKKAQRRRGSWFDRVDRLIRRMERELEGEELARVVNYMVHEAQALLIKKEGREEDAGV